MSAAGHVQPPFISAQAAPRGAHSFWWSALAVILGVVFVYAGALKAWDPLRFAHDMQNFHIVPWSLGVRLAFYLPWLEILAGLALLSGILRPGALAILSALMIVFIAATISARLRGINLDCGCFGSVGKGLSFTSHILIDGAILAGLIVLVVVSLRDARRALAA